MAEDLPGADSFRQNQRLRIFIPIVFFIGIFLLALGGGLFLFRGGQEAGDIQIITGDETAGDLPAGRQVVVHVDGAVKSPGVYKLTAGARVADAVGAAGGLSADADGSRINLAAKLADGQKIYITKIGESVSQSVGGSVSQSVSESVSQLININTASESELDKLPQVGPVTAQKIIASRPYSGLEDLLTKKVVSRSTFDKIKELISL